MSAKMADSPEARAVKIAAHIMQENGICRYDDVAKCRRLSGFVTEAVCEKCLAGYLLSKARREIRKERGLS